MRPTTLAFAAALVFSASAHAGDQARTLPPFTALDVHGPVSVTVDAGKPQSVTVHGEAKFIAAVTTEVVNGELRLRAPDRKSGMWNNDARVLVTVPSLRALAVEGAGEIRLNGVRGDRLDVDYRGAGRVVVGGEVQAFRMQAEGVGEVDAKALVANDVDIRFRGIGDVKVTARRRLDADVEGMGSLTYYGRPAIVNKSASGIGSVHAGD